jgi:hypothetical protein
MLFSIVTGLGHVYLRHYVLGAILFALFAMALNGVFLGTMIESKPQVAHALFETSVPLAVAIWVIGLVHAYRISYGTDRKRLRAERQRLFREGLIAYLRGDLDAASRALQSVAERDVDWEETDALFHLGVVELRRSAVSQQRGDRRASLRQRRRGLRAFKACLARDDRKKWRGEIANERERAKAPVRPSLLYMVSASTDSSDERPIPPTGFFNALPPKEPTT